MTFMFCLYCVDPHSLCTVGETHRVMNSGTNYSQYIKCTRRHCSYTQSLQLMMLCEFTGTLYNVGFIIKEFQSITLKLEHHKLWNLKTEHTTYKIMCFGKMQKC